MTEPTLPDRLSLWPAILGQLDDAQLEALGVTVAALTADNLEAAELLEYASEANRLGLALDLAVMQGPEAVAVKKLADTRAGLVAQISELATEAQCIATDMEMAAMRLADFDDAG